MSQHQHYLVFTLFLVLSIGLFESCKTDPKTDTTTSVAVSNPTVTVGMRAEPDAINPILSRRGAGRTVYRHIFNSLLYHEPKDGSLVPFLAKSQPEIKSITEGKFAGGRSYTYEIRPEAKWADGKPVLASDYLFTMKIVFNPNVPTGWRAALAFVGDIEATPENPRRFTIYTASCQIKEDEYLATTNVYPEHIYDPEGLMRSFALTDLLDAKKSKELKADEKIQAFAKQFTSPDFSRESSKVMGSGAYRLASFKTKEEVVLEKMENWWGEQLAAKESIFTAVPEKLIYKIVPDMTTATTMLKDGELDLMGEIAPESYQELRESELGQKNLNFESPNVPSVYFCPMNSKRPTLSDVDVRRAITHLIDLDKYIEEEMHGLAFRVNNPFPPNRPYYNNDLPLPKLDIEKAKDLLEASGWQDKDSDGVREKKIGGKTVPLKIELKLPLSSVDGNKVAQLLQANAKQIGMQIDIVHKDYPTIMRQDVPAGDYDIICIGTRFTPSRYDDARTYFQTKYYATAKGRNYSFFGNAKSDALLDKIANNCDDDATRNADYKAFQKMVYDECPYLFLYSTKERLAINKRFDKIVTSEARPGFFENYFVSK